MSFLYTDCECLVSQMKHQEKQLIRKRRWLMGLPPSKSEQKNLKFLKCRSVPESLLREDDVFSENIRECIEKGFGACNSGVGHLLVDNNTQHFMSHDIKEVLSLLDDLTNKGLYNFAKILTGGSLKFEKTRRKMKKLIRECLSKIPKNPSCNHQQTDLLAQLSELLKDKNYFQKNCMIRHHSAAQCHHAAVTKVLDGLEDMPFQTLIAMHRKLRVVSGYMPNFQTPKSGWVRDRLVKQVRDTSLEMLSKHGEGDELQEALAKAMAVAKLSMKLTLGNWNPSTTEFYHFSPGIEALQNDIIKAIWLLKKVRAPELKTLQLVLDPNAEVSNRSLRSGIRKILTEYLFECGDDVSVPKSLQEALNIINKCSWRLCVSDKVMEEEVELLLSISAHIKQILWDLLLDCGLDQDYTDAYVEDLEESDNSDDFDDGGQQPESRDLQTSRFHSSYSNELSEIIGESNSAECKPCTSSNQGIGSSQLVPVGGRLNDDSVEGCEPGHITHTPPIWQSKFLNNERVMDENQYQEVIVDVGTTDNNLITSTTGKSGSPPLASPNGKIISHPTDREATESDPCMKANFMPETTSTSRNRYLAFQEVCDRTSVVAYCLIGRTLELSAQAECLNLDFIAESYLRSPEERQTTSQKDVGQTLSGKNVGDPVILQAVEELIPSFPNRGVDILKELMALE